MGGQKRNDRPVRADQRLTIGALASMAIGEKSWDEIEAAAGVAEVVADGTRDVLTRRQAARFMHFLASASAVFAGALPEKKRDELVQKMQAILNESAAHDAMLPMTSDCPAVQDPADRIRGFFSTREDS